MNCDRNGILCVRRSHWQIVLVSGRVIVPGCPLTEVQRHHTYLGLSQHNNIIMLHINQPWLHEAPGTICKD